MQAVILAGGQGTRLRSVVDDVPKSLVPIRGRPFLAFLLEFLEQCGVRKVVIAVGYRREQIMAAFGTQFGSIAIQYAVESEPLGTGGALRNALGLVDRFPVFALNGDTYAEIDLQGMLRAHAAAGAQLTMAVRRTFDPGRYGHVSVEDGYVTGFAAQGTSLAALINSGFYLFADNLLDDPALPKSFSFETNFLEQRIGDIRPLAFETEGYFIDIGVPADYRRAQRDLPDAWGKPFT
jgi:D-glycero-alpha-D-manno-heptose 1-phosphate guanylyltransferase